MTYPHIGNYGVNQEDVESSRPWVEGFVVRERSPIVSNFRAQMSLEDYLTQHGVVAIDGIDTRALTLKLRQEGYMNGGISTQEQDPQRLLEKVRAAPSIVGADLVKDVTCAKPDEWSLSTGAQFHVVVIDYGVKYNILRQLAQRGCYVNVVPAATSADEVLAMKPDGVVLSNGPGDPAVVTYAVEAIRGLLGHVPILGICLGHQLLGLAYGGETFKLKFGHHGGNHPVQDLATGKVTITTQNHNFAVRVESIPGQRVEVTHKNLNDATVEGMRHKTLPVFSVQYHPEASPGPHDAHHLFDQFLHLMATRA
jgi:carbamoyl-phosphate synthase small subunit